LLETGVSAGTFFFLLAFLSLITGSSILALRYLGAVPSNFITENGLQIGSALEVVLLSFALADRINLMKKEKEEAQAEAVINLQMKLVESGKLAAMAKTFEKICPSTIPQSDCPKRHR